MKRVSTRESYRLDIGVVNGSDSCRPRKNSKRMRPKIGRVNRRMQQEKVLSQKVQVPE